ncbi:MAG: glycosyltransferase family 4 protein [Eubacteriales bacterium]|nr:glycosyltransferase family 4 protein [Eubacteriales bacterium]
MRLLWLCNVAPSEVRQAAYGKPGSGWWLDHAFSDLRKTGNTMRILYPEQTGRGELDDKCCYATFRRPDRHKYDPAMEVFFRQELRDFQPDVIHIWGTEYAHTLAMLRCCEEAGLLDRTAVSIQGLCTACARHYTEGIPHAIQRRFTFRDFLRQDNILQQQKKYALRGDMETKALQLTRHIIGRTDWDRACTSLINPQAQYHFCNETLRSPFYTSRWRYENCQKHQIFSSSCVYPIKGFHYLLEAFALVLQKYPDATLAVPGASFLDRGLKSTLRRDSYHKYLVELTKKYHLEDKITFLGKLTPERMKEQYLRANVFTLPSTVDNSPNSLGEAMLLGTPCVAADVGGVSTMLTHGTEGFLYPSADPGMLAYDICRVFEMETQAEELGAAASRHAAATHDPEKNLAGLLEIYRQLSEKES